MTTPLDLNAAVGDARANPTTARLVGSLREFTRHALLQRSGVIFVINIVGLATAAVAQILLARTLGAVEFGYYAYAFAWLSVTSLLATVGFQSSVVRFGAIYVSQSRHALMRRFSRFAHLMGAAAGSFILIVGCTLIWQLDDDLQEGLALTLLVSLCATPIIALTRISGSCLRVYGRHITAVFSEVCLREMAVLAFIALSLLALPNPATASDLMTAVLVVSCAALVTLQLQLTGLRRTADEAGAGHVVQLPVREWLRSSGYLLLFTTANLLQKRVDVLLAGVLFGTTSAGAYSVAIYLAGLAVLPQTAIGFVAAPEIARLHAQGSRERLHKTIRLTALGSSAAAAVIAIVLWTAAPLVPTMIAPEFEATIWPARILVLGHLLNATFGCLEVVVTMAGNEKHAAHAMVLLTVINLPLLWLWMNLFGLVGAACGTVVITLAFKIYCFALVYRRHGLLSSIFVTSPISPNSLRG